MPHEPAARLVSLPETAEGLGMLLGVGSALRRAYDVRSTGFAFHVFWSGGG